MAWVAWAGLLFGGLAAGPIDAAAGGRMPPATRLASSGVLALAAWGWLATAWVERAGLYALLIAVGMSLGLVGDLFMASVLPAPHPALGGMGAFALGHMAYCGAFLVLAGTPGVAAGPVLTLSWLVWLGIGVASWYAVAQRGERPGLLRALALPYTLLLASTAGLGLGLGLTRPVLLLLALGGALFFVSDLLIAMRLFRDVRRPEWNDLIWLTYGPAQMLIVYSVGLARGLMR